MCLHDFQVADQDDMSQETETEAPAGSHSCGAACPLQHSSDVPDDDKSNVNCGIGKYSPKWLQVLASKKSYVVVYGVLGMSQSAIGSYFVGTISTIEKRFRLPSSMSGFIASSWDFGALCTVLVMTYFGSSGHKTRWVAFCALFTAISCFLRYIPFILYGTSPNISLSLSNSNNTSYDLCNGSQGESNCTLNSEGFVTSIILTIAHIALGIGTSTYNTLGAAYLDDNSLKNKAPFLLSIAICFRQLGPTVGFLLASYALSNHETQRDRPAFEPNDQRWVGAWQLGWIPLGMVHLFLALLMAFFPKTLPREAQRRKLRQPMLHRHTNKQWSLNDLKYKLEGLLRNPVLMCNALSSTSYMFGVIGYMVFMPKYIEAQFMQSASKANFITGTLGLICTIVGVILSGTLISKLKPHPRYIAGWSFLTKSVEVLVHILFAFISCNKGTFSGVSLNDNRLNLVSHCNFMCDCTSEHYSPVCSLELQTTFFSPCHAGCKASRFLNGSMVFSECNCVPGVTLEGACPTSCENHFFIFLALLCFLRFLSSTGRAGNTIIQYRSVDPDVKSLSIALSEVMLCGLAFIPAPIIYGMILDSSCLVWGSECGQEGNCLLYDEKKLRFYLNFTAAGFLFIAAMLDFCVFRSVKKLNIYDDDKGTYENNEVIDKLNNTNDKCDCQIKDSY